MFFKKKKKEKVSEEPLMCPRCLDYMKKKKKYNVIIDICKKCKGMWLDAGEIEKLSAMAKERLKEV